jgi:hypothetical protein
VGGGTNRDGKDGASWEGRSDRKGRDKKRQRERCSCDMTNRKREKMCNMLIKGCKEKADQRFCKEDIQSDSHWNLCVCFVCVYNITRTYTHTHHFGLTGLNHRNPEFLRDMWEKAYESQDFCFGFLEGFNL